MTESQPHIVIIGGGITGLSAAWHFQQNAAGFAYTLLENPAVGAEKS
ncbi:MAG: FAD-dependent oxidoreductase [Anaerolineae bacterium]|nr:FAD-dependent oxidoreductase [Anaerolineae bacterium]